MDDEAWEILEEINKHDLAQALVPFPEAHRHDLLQDHIKSSVTAIAKDDPNFVDDIANQLVEAAKNRIAHPENQEFHGLLASEAYSHGILMEMIRRAGRIFEETNSPHLGKMENKFNREIYSAPEMDTFLHEIATVMRHLLFPTHPFIAAAIAGADFLLHYGDTLTAATKFFDYEKINSSQKLVHDYPIIKGNSIGWIKFETIAEQNISPYWCLWKKNVIELEAKRSYFYFETKEDFEIALLAAMKEKAAMEKKILETWDVVEDDE